MSASLQGPLSHSNSSDVRDGLIYSFIAYALWGMMPLYLKQVESVPPFEIVMHRIVWSVVFGAVLIGFRRQWRDVRKALTTRKTLFVLSIAAILIALNWLIYVWAVVDARVLAASLGYFINPLMYVAAGVFIFKEKLRRLQMIAIIVALLGVIVLTIGVGKFPWVAIVLALLFTGYGYIRKTTPVKAMPGLFVETLVISPFALLYLLYIWQQGAMVFGTGDVSMDLLLMLAGPVTIMPLMLFSFSARRLTMTTLGIMQYLGPTLQFLFAIYFGELFTIYHAICFVLIWTALAIFTWDSLGELKRQK